MKKFSFVAVLSLFLIVRLLLVFYSPHVYLNEELKQASLGTDLLRGGLSLPFWCYLDSPHAGGSIFSGLSLVPFYLVFGRGYLALKIAALAYSFVAFLIVCFLLRRYYSWSKILFPLFVFFIFSTPHYLQKSLFLTGNTVEFLFAGFLFSWLIDRILINKKEGRFSYIMLGVVAGLGLWIQYLFLVFLITFFIFWIFQKGFSIFKFKFWQFCAGFGLGFSPWLIYNALYGWPSIYADARVTPLLISPNIEPFFFYLAKLRDLTWFEIPRSFHFLPLGIISPQLIAYTLYILFWGSLLFLLFSKAEDARKRKFQLFWIKLFFISLLSFVIFPFPVGNPGSRWGSLNPHFEFYLLFFQPVMFVIMSMAYVEFKRKKFFIPFRWGCYVFLPVMLLQYLQMSDFSRLDKTFARDLSVHTAESNAYETGFNFALRPLLWKEVWNKIEIRSYREAYLKGSAEFWGSNLNSPVPAVPLEYLDLKISYLSEQKHKEIFLRYVDEFADREKGKN